MIKNLLKISLRNLLKNKTFTSINIIGLAIGLSASFIIGAIILYDLSFDKFHPEEGLIYRVTTDIVMTDAEFYNRGVPTPLAKEIREKVSGVDLVSMFILMNQKKVTRGETGRIYNKPDKIIYADQEYFKLFPYQWLAGNPNKILSNPNEVVLTEERAKKYFPELTPELSLGKILIYNDSIPVTVVGIVKYFNRPTDFYFQEFISFKSAISFGHSEFVANDNWFGFGSNTQVFFKRNENSSLAEIEKGLTALAEEHESPQELASGQKKIFKVQPLGDIHFNPKYGIFDDSEHQGNINLLFSLAIVALFLLLLSCINFINLSTAQGLKRSKEIGIRKVLGSSRKQLVFQFLGEALFTTIAAAFISLFFSALIFRGLSEFIPNGMDFSIFTDPKILLLILLLIIIVTISSGFYPALVLSNYRPASVFRNDLRNLFSKVRTRKFLTVFQFVVAQLFIIMAIIVAKQINFLTSKDIGFKTNAIASMNIDQIQDLNKRLLFIKELRSMPQVNSTSFGGGTPLQAMMAHPITYIRHGEEILTYVIKLHGDLEYVKLYDIKLLAGRDRLNDSIEEFLINNTYSRLLGFDNPNEAIGSTLLLKREGKKVPIVGVMDDINTASLHYTIEPQVLTGNHYSKFSNVQFALGGKPDSWPETIIKIKTIWEKLFPELDFDIKFIKETLNTYYEQERRVSVLMRLATILAILISCMGLLGLVIYTTERRAKEIGIRKVLGASIRQLNALLCKEFLLLIVVGFIIAVPLAWIASNYWLERFAFRTPRSWWVFLIGGITMALLALFTIGAKTASAAKLNPLDNLHSD